MIVSISFRNFRGIAERLISFGPNINYLRGPNEAGKSSIAEAVFFALVGTDAAGNKNPDHLISEGQDTAEVALKTDKACFIRKKKRGQTSEIQLLREGYPPLKLNQTELTKLLNIDTDIFGSCFLVGYFMGLPDERKLQVIAQVAKLDRFSILDEMMGFAYKSPSNLPKNVKLINPRIDADAVAKDRRVLSNQLSNDEGALSMVEAELIRLTGETIDEASYQIGVNELTAKVDLHEKYRIDLSIYEHQISRVREAEKHNSNIDVERKKYLEAIEQLGPRPQLKEGQHETLLNELLANKANIVKTYKTTPNFSSPAGSIQPGVCLTCKQPVSGELVAKQAEEREKALVEFNKLEREIADHNSKVKEHETYLSKEIEKLDIEKSNFQEKDRFWKEKTAEFEDRLSRLKPVKVPEPIAPLKPEGNPDSMKQELIKLQTDLSVYRLNKTKRIELERKKSDLRIAADAKIDQIRNLKSLEDALRKLPEKEVELTAEKLKLENATVKLADGMLHVSDMKGIPYSSLSKGRRTKVGIEWCKRFQVLHQPSPGFYFLDDADLLDSLTEHLPRGSQVFVAKVDPTIKELQVVEM